MAFRHKNLYIFVFIFLVISICPLATMFVIPEEVPMGLATIFGFFPPFSKGNDHRIGFGFRLGNHADFQVLYEFGPQTLTAPLQPIRARSIPPQRNRFAVRRRPFIELLLRAGILHEETYGFDEGKDIDEPR